MPIQHIKATKTASLTDLRDPRKIIDSLVDGQVAILDRNKVVAYLKHPSTENRDYTHLDGCIGAYRYATLVWFDC